MKLRNLTMVSLLAIALATVACTAPSWVNTVEADAQVAAPIAASLVDVIDPALAPQVTLIENGFTTLVKTLDAYKASPTATNLQTVQAAFQAVNGNVAQLESAAQIKNPISQAKVTAVVQLLAQAVTEIAAVVPANTGLAPHVAGLGTENTGSQIPNSPSLSAKGLKAKDFKQQFNSIIAGDPQFAGKELK
jgi:hypothetical protein